MTRVMRIVHGDEPATDAPRIRRLATRAVVLHGESLLLLRSRSGDYRFPGGGLDEGESLESNLARELLEECGARLLRVDEHLLTVVDERPAREPGAVFAQESRFYRCDVHDGLADVDHDLRERTLELEPVWVEVQVALESNRALRDARRTAAAPLSTDTAEDPDDLAWIERETLALEVVAGYSGGASSVVGFSDTGQ
ncbi:MAG: NUDIX hydrolase [Candidatus Nanopelagicales bacterium]